MSDTSESTELTESTESSESSQLFADRVSEDVAAISELVASGIEVDGEAQVCESTWVIYGHSSYDGEIVVGQYQDPAEASEVLRAAQGPAEGPAQGPGPDDRSVP
jgi:hypothetical protein